MPADMPGLMVTLDPKDAEQLRRDITRAIENTRVGEQFFFRIWPEPNGRVSWAVGSGTPETLRRDMQNLQKGPAAFPTPAPWPRRVQ